MPRIRLRFTPAHFLWLKSRLEKGDRKFEIARAFVRRFGSTEETIKSYMKKYFPTNLSLTQALEVYRQTFKTESQRKQLTGQRAKAWWAELTPEERRKIHSGRMSPEERSERGRKGFAAVTSKQRSESMRVRWAKLPLKKRERWIRNAASKKTKEQRSEAAEKGNVKMGPEQRSVRSRKAGLTRSQNLIKDIIYVEKLPFRNLLSQREMQDRLKELSEVIAHAVERFSQRPDFEEISSEVNYGVIVALAKWDKKLDLRKLVLDSIKLQLINYFVPLKRQKWIEIHFRQRH